MTAKTVDGPGWARLGCLDPQDARAIHRLLEPDLTRLQARLILFGSRARGDAHAGSDIDLAIQADGPVPEWLLSRMRERLEDSRLPWRVDLVDYARAPAPLRAAIDREGIPWPT